MNTRIKVKKGLLPKSRKWYCYYCDRFTKTIDLKYNTTKCLCCGRRKYDNGYDCPSCGAEHDGDDWSETLLGISDKRYVSTPDGSGYEWVETHKCWHCGTIYEFYNSSF